VVQAAGRVIRTPTDRGVLWLMDKRYAQPQVRELLPRHWRVRIIADPDDPVLGAAPLAHRAKTPLQ
jgi:Rad3-related DNA helicase